MLTLTVITSSGKLTKYFKYVEDAANYDDLTPSAKIVFNDMIDYCAKKNQTFLISSFISTVTEDDALERVSSAHREGRAFDLSITTWSDEQKKEFVRYYNNDSMLKTLGAYSLSDNVQRLVVHHNSGFGDHIHVQVKR